MNTYSIIGVIITSIPLAFIIAIVIKRGKNILDQ